jgi:hypothetical protein
VKRNDWLVDSSLKYSDVPGTLLFLSVQLSRLTLLESALPFQVWTKGNMQQIHIISFIGESPCISSLKVGVLLLPPNT